MVGSQTRKVTCVGGETCDLDLKPHEQQPCGGETCPEPGAHNSTEDREMEYIAEENVPTPPENRSDPLTTLDNGLLLASSSDIEKKKVPIHLQNSYLGNSAENTVINAGVSPSVKNMNENVAVIPHKQHPGHGSNQRPSEQNQANQELYSLPDPIEQGSRASDVMAGLDAKRRKAGEATKERTSSEAQEQGIPVQDSDFKWYAGEWTKVFYEHLILFLSVSNPSTPMSHLPFINPGPFQCFIL